MANTPSIIAFTKDWNDVPTCTTHILREMGKTIPVLWINSIGMRKPSLASGRDLQRIAQKLRAGFRRAENKEHFLRVLSPLVLPKATSPAARWVNRRLLAHAVNRECSDSGSVRELWSFVPNGADYLGALGERKVIYYCADDWTKFTIYDPHWIAQCEATLAARATKVFATSRFLENKFRPLAGNRVHYMPHGVNYAHFAHALSPELPLPADVRNLPSPLIGFYGNIYDWVDLDLIATLAVNQPDWSFVLIGPVMTDITRCAGVPNIHFLGRRDQELLPAYCKAFDAAIIPYKLTDPRMESVNPVKLRELLAAGVPIVTADIPEVRGLSAYVRTARTPEDFLRGLQEFLTIQPDRAAISAERRADDWAERVRQIRQIVEAAP